MWLGWIELGMHLYKRKFRSIVGKIRENRLRQLRDILRKNDNYETAKKICKKLVERNRTASKLKKGDEGY